MAEQPRDGSNRSVDDGRDKYVTEEIETNGADMKLTHDAHQGQEAVIQEDYNKSEDTVMTHAMLGAAISSTSKDDSFPGFATPENCINIIGDHMKQFLNAAALTKLSQR